MNLVQLVRKARLNADAVLPTGQVSSLWGDDEMVDLVTEANEEINLRFQATHKKWGLQTVSQSDGNFTRDGEIYSPSTALRIAPQTDVAGKGIATRITLPPDFGEMVRVTCVSNRTVRFLPALVEMSHWIDMEQGSFQTTGLGVLPSTPDGLTFYYDITGNRTMVVIPPVTQTFDIAIDYIPMKRPLYFTAAGTISLTNGSTAVVGTGTSFQTSGLFSEVSSQACELIVGTNSITDATISLATDYLRIASIESDTTATLVSPYQGANGSGLLYIMAMAPTVPRTYHRWISRLITALMLAKVSPQLSSEYAQGVMQKFGEVIQPTARVRQSQESAVVEDAEEFGVTSQW